MAEIEHIRDLLEGDTMLAERIESWFDEATQKGVQQGMQQGMQQGVQQGVLKGQTSILSKLLRLRFGVLPPEAIERLSRATQAELDAWGEAILSAPTLDAVFGETRH
jgi:flagellar biosynthesis/type III secretory pathway protein FliH